MTEQGIIDFINKNNYDIRVHHNARWIDQSVLRMFYALSLTVL